MHDFLEKGKDNVKENRYEFKNVLAGYDKLKELYNIEMEQGTISDDICDKILKSSKMKHITFTKLFMVIFLCPF